MSTRQQDIKEYGGVVRVLQLMPKFRYCTKRGGCGIYRSVEREGEVVLVTPKVYRVRKEKGKGTVVLERRGTGYECPRPRKGLEWMELGFVAVN